MLTLTGRALAAALLLSACGDDPYLLTNVVGTDVAVRSADVEADNTLLVERPITTAGDQRFNEFIAAYRDNVRPPPAALSVDAVRLELGALSTGVTALDEVLAGDANLAFVTYETNNSYNVVRWTAPTGVEDTSGEVTFDWASVSPGDTERLVAGNFKLALTATAAVGFAAKNADARLELELRLTAYE